MSKRVVGWGLSTVLAALALSAAPASAAVGSITTGAEHTCALKTSGTPVCWGNDAKSQVTVPDDVAELTGIDAGARFNCGIKPSKAPVCWGETSDGQTTIPAGTTSVTQISAGVAHACAVKTGGDPVCWGLDDDHQTEIPAGTGTVTQISAGAFHTCAIKSDGTPACWGWNEFGQVSPIPAAAANVKQISSGLRHTCAITTDDAAVCWGDNTWDQRTVPAGIGTVSAISAGKFHTCAIKTDGTPVCWGANGADQNFGQTTIPNGIGTVTRIAAGDTHTCAVTTAGHAVCWGDDADGQRGTPPAITNPAPPTNVGGATYSHTVTITGSLGPVPSVTSGDLPPGLSFDATFDPGTGAFTGEITGTPTQTGVFTGTIRASDGIFADATQPFSIAVDITAPVTTDDVPAGPVNHAVTVTLDTTDEGWADVAHTYYTTDGTTPTTGSPTYSAASKPVLNDGQTIKYFSVDTAGNTEAVGSSSPAHVDTTAPTVTISAPVNGGTYTKGRSVLAAYACSDACTGTVAAGAAIDTNSVGKHAFTVVARDDAGNETTKTVTYTVVAPPATVVTPPDTTGPVVTIPGKNKTLVQRKGVVRFTLGKALEPTTGTIALKAKGLKVGSAKFTAANGQVVILKIRLSKKAKKALAKRGKLKAQALITVKDGAGNATVKTFKLTIKKR